MKRTISLLLVTLLILTGAVSAFAADAAVPSDVKGTKYETAVTELMEKIGLAGYTDGTFRPENTINRAEICTILVKAMQPAEADLAAAPKAFNDMTASDISWAASYVNYGASKKLVAGYNDGGFHPQDSVTYNEVATMLVNALGYTDKDLTGTWPENYVSKAKELGIYENVEAEGKGDSAASRGDVALMTAVVADKIVETSKKEDDSNTQTNNPAKPSDSDNKPTDSDTKPADSDNNNAIFENAGGAYGMINDIFSVTNTDGDKVDQIAFFINGATYNLNTNKAGLISDVVYDGSLYYIKFNGAKEVRNIYQDPSQASPKHYEIIAGKTGFVDVTDRTKSVATVTEDAVSADLTIMDNAVFYKATFEDGEINGYEKGNLNDIRTGAKLRAYDVTDDDGRIADIVVYITKNDAEKYGL